MFLKRPSMMMLFWLPWRRNPKQGSLSPLQVNKESITVDLHWRLSRTDYWSASLAYHFLNGTSSSNFFDLNAPHGAGILWSDIAQLSSFQSHQVPFPLLNIDTFSSNQNNSNIGPGATVPLSNIIYEVSPYEFGAYDPQLAAFVSLPYVGTNLTNGNYVNTSSCVNAFDQASFIMGSSSALWNDFETPVCDIFQNFTADGGAN
jgi:lysophospholipase